MKMLLKTTAAVAMLAGFAAPAFGQAAEGNKATATVESTTTIVTPLSITSSGKLQFGKIIKPASATSDTVTVSAAGARSLSSSSATLFGGDVTVPTFTVKGEESATYSISTPAFELAKGSDKLTVTLAPSKASGTIAVGGTDTFTVGGSFPITKDTPAGAYTGNFNVTVQYN